MMVENNYKTKVGKNTIIWKLNKVTLNIIEYNFKSKREIKVLLNLDTKYVTNEHEHKSPQSNLSEANPTNWKRSHTIINWNSFQGFKDPSLYAN